MNYIKSFNEIPKNKYGIIYADPPWKFKNKKTGGTMMSGSEHQYNVMSVDDLRSLPVSQISTENAVLFMWWVASMPQEALDLTDAWGFTLKTMTCFNWVKKTKNGKDHFGMGFHTRQSTESCLIAVKGKPKRVSASVRSVVYARIGKHSEKPLEVKTRIVQLMGNLTRIELFAKTNADDVAWDYWGDQIEAV